MIEALQRDHTEAPHLRAAITPARILYPTVLLPMSIKFGTVLFQVDVQGFHAPAFPKEERLRDILSVDNLNDAGLTKLISYVSRQIASSNTARLEAELKDFDFSSLPLSASLAILRTSYAARERLGFWDPLRDAVSRKATADGRDPNRLLRGI